MWSTFPRNMLTQVKRRKQVKRNNILSAKKRSLSRKAYFNEKAEHWDKEFYTPELVARLEELAPKFGIRHGQKILDAGTGTGVLIPFLLRAIGATGSITAIDYAENMVKVFKNKFSKIKKSWDLLNKEENFPFLVEIVKIPPSMNLNMKSSNIFYRQKPSNNN